MPAAKNDAPQPMRILLAIKAMASPGGGAERILADLATYLVDQGHQVTVLTFDQPDAESFYPIDSRVERRFLGIGNIKEGTRPGEALERILTMRREVAHLRPDVVVGFMHSIYVPMAFALIGVGVPLIASEHIVPQHYWSRRIEYLLILLSSLFITKFTIISENIRRSYHWLLRRKAVVVPNPVRIPRNVQAPDEASQTILSVGRLTEQKDQITLIRAFAPIAEQFPEWTLRIIGEGPLRSELETLIARLGLEHKVFLPGSTKNIEAEYHQASFFVTPSRYESFGLATAEAMGYGLAVIGFADCPGTNELIQNGVNGILVNSSQRVPNLSQAIGKLIRDPLLRTQLGSYGKERIQLHSPQRIHLNWLKLLKRVSASDSS